MTRPARPYQGTRIIPIRLADDLIVQIQEAIASNNKRRRDAEYNLSDWVRVAIRERLDKLARGRKSAQKKSAQAETGQAAGETPAAGQEQEQRPAEERPADQ